MVARNTEIKDLFKAWCGRMGYKPVRRVDALSAVGEAALYFRKGEYSIEVASPVVPGSATAKYTNATHGYTYPLLWSSETQARKFLAA